VKRKIGSRKWWLMAGFGSEGVLDIFQAATDACPREGDSVRMAWPILTMTAPEGQAICLEDAARLFEGRKAPTPFSHCDFGPPVGKVPVLPDILLILFIRKEAMPFHRLMLTIMPRLTEAPLATTGEQDIIPVTRGYHVSIAQALDNIRRSA
jgi:hypothetical protein